MLDRPGILDRCNQFSKSELSDFFVGSLSWLWQFPCAIRNTANLCCQNCIVQAACWCSFTCCLTKVYLLPGIGWLVFCVHTSGTSAMHDLSCYRCMTRHVAAFANCKVTPGYCHADMRHMRSSAMCRSLLHERSCFPWVELCFPVKVERVLHLCICVRMAERGLFGSR